MNRVENVLIFLPVLFSQNIYIMSKQSQTGNSKPKDSLQYLYETIIKMAEDKQYFDSTSNLKNLRRDEFAGWYNDFNQKLKSLSHIEAEDLILDSLLKFISHKKKNSSEQALGRQNDKAYFKQIIKNGISKQFKKNGLDMKELGEDEIPDKYQSNAEDMDRASKILTEILLYEKALKNGGSHALKPGEICSFFANGIYKWENVDIEAKTGIIVNTLKSHMYRAKKTLRKFVEDNYDKFDAFQNN